MTWFPAGNTYMRWIFKSLFYCSGVFPGALASGLVRGGDLKPVFFTGFRAFFSLFFWLFVLHLIRLKPFVQFDSGFWLNSHRCNSRLWAKPAFPLFLRFRWSTQPALSLPVRPFFSPFFPFLSIKVTYPVGFPPAWHEVLLTAASINDWY